MRPIRSSHKAYFLVRFIIGLLVTAALTLPQAQAHAAYWCQCVDYIKNRYALSGSIGGSGGAKDMGPYLSARGFVQIYTPKIGAVVILKPAFGRGTNSTYGHVAVITAVSDLGTDWRISMRGANQNNGSSTEYNCTNVGNWTPASYPKSFGSNEITYWTRNFALGRPTRVSSVQGGGYEGYRANDGSMGTRWSSRITGPSTEWWIADMQATRTFDRISLRWEAAYATRYFIGWGNDGTNFTGYWISATSAQNITWVVGVRTARYAIVYMTNKAWGMGNYSLWEVRVFANGNPAAPGMLEPAAVMVNRELSNLSVP